MKNQKGLKALPTVYSGYVFYGWTKVQIHGEQSERMFIIESNNTIKLTEREAKLICKELKE